MGETQQPAAKAGGDSPPSATPVRARSCSASACTTRIKTSSIRASPRATHCACTASIEFAAKSGLAWTTREPAHARSLRWPARCPSGIAASPRGPAPATRPAASSVGLRSDRTPSTGRMLGGAEFGRAAFAVKEDVAPHPVPVGVIGRDRAVANPNRLTPPIEQARLGLSRPGLDVGRLAGRHSRDRVEKRASRFIGGGVHADEFGRPISARPSPAGMKLDSPQRGEHRQRLKMNDLHGTNGRGIVRSSMLRRAHTTLA